MLVIAGLGNPGARLRAQPPQHRLHGDRGDRRGASLRAVPRPLLRRSRPRARSAASASLLLAPQTYMNESGRSVGEALRFHKLDLGALTVIHDELDLAPGQGAGQGRRRQRRTQRPALDHRPCRQRLQARPARHRPSRRQGAGAPLRAERLRQGGGGLGRGGLPRDRRRRAAAGRGPGRELPEQGPSRHRGGGLRREGGA